ncbi:MAG: metallophosphoesterase [Christensenellales bacterium]
MIWPGNKTLVISRYSFVKGVTQEFQDVWDVLRVVHLSDLQGACFGNDNMELLGRVSDTKPHLIVFTGDLVDRRMQVNKGFELGASNSFEAEATKDFEAAIDFMKNLRMIAPTFFSYGNHELAFSQDIVRALREKLENTGVVVLDGTSHIENVKIRKLPDDKLRDESRRNDDTASRNVEVLLTGFPERLLMVEGRNRTKKNSDVDQDVLKSAVEEIKQKRSESQCDISILLAHEPQFIEEYSSASYDYIFSGHAHGGQIRLPILGGLFSPGQGILPKYTSGVHNAGNGKMIISRGLGNSSFPIRVFNRPEIIIAEIHI